jgi:large subunit ribosomal protein L4
MEKVLYEISGKESGKINVSDSIFGMEVKNHLIYDKIKNELANRRVGTASTKTRGEVRGGGRKPWRQKGTGRARQGSIRAPHWVGGGVTFGPQPRDYSYSLPKKMRRLALMTTLSHQFQRENTVKIVKDFTIENGKTKDAFQVITALTQGKQERTLLIFAKEDEMLKRALRNIPWVRYMSADRLASHEIFYAKHVLIMEGAVKRIEEKYADVAKNN